MENREFTPSESLALIASVISDAKTRFHDNGFSFIFLGLCSFAASLGQFVLIQLGYYQINYFPYFIMPIAGIITYFYYKNKKETVKSTNIIGSLLSLLGIILGLNLMIAGFFFWNKFGLALIPFMLILFSLWPLLTGVLIRNRFFIATGIAINIIAYGSFFLEKEFHALVLSVVSLIGIVVPGIILNFSRNESHV
ncbi:MAG: hypothetical protein WCX31_17175 [Salinivirgaceae bacterium]|jgi:hypothetical protein